MPGLSTATICTASSEAAVCQTPASAALLGQPWWYTTVAADVAFAAGLMGCNAAGETVGVGT
jgi:hypothetical protein